MHKILSIFSAFDTQEFVFLAVCFILFINIFYFLWSSFSTKALLKDSLKAHATVTAVQEMEDPRGKYQQLTLVFRDESGVEFAPVIENMFTPRQKGQNLEVFYIKNDPSNIVINDWRSLRMKTFIGFIGVVVTTAVGFYLLMEGLIKIPEYVQEFLSNLM